MNVVLEVLRLFINLVRDYTHKERKNPDERLISSLNQIKETFHSECLNNKTISN